MVFDPKHSHHKGQVRRFIESCGQMAQVGNFLFRPGFPQPPFEFMKTSVSILIATLAFGLSASAQGPAKGKGKGRPLPLQGKELPEVTAFDEKGEVFPLKQKLKGRHGVIVFGCLT